MIKDPKNQKQLDAEITSALLSDFDRFEHFFVNNWKKIVQLCVLVVIIVAAVYSYQLWRKIDNRKTSDEFAAANTAEQLAAIVKKYPDHDAAIAARLRLAVMLLNDSKYAEAAEQYQVLLRRSLSSELAWRLKLDTAYLNELQGNLKEAAAVFAALSDENFIPEEMRCEANYSAGRIYAKLKESAKAGFYLKKAAAAIVFRPGTGAEPNMAVDFWKRQATLLIDRIEAEKKAAVIKPAAASAVIPSVGKTSVRK